VIPAGTVLDFNVRGQTTAAQFQIVFNEAMLAGTVSTYLQELLTLVDLDVKADGTVITGTLPWDYTARVRVRTRAAHQQASDVGAIVANSFFRATGNMPSSVTQPSGGGAGTGQPLPRLPDLSFPDVPWTTAIVVAGVAVLVLAWKF
jgi:hypothetical protein